MAQQQAWLETLAGDRAEMARSSASERVAAALRTRIIDGSLRPGTQLSEQAIGQTLGVSRNTLREAFHLLSHDRLVVHELNRGVFVRRLDADDLRELYRFRRLVETAALRQAAPGRADLAELRAAVADGERAAAAQDWQALGSANMRFHRGLAGLARSRRLDEVMEQVLAEMRLVFSEMADPEGFHGPYLAHNQELVALLEAGRADDAERSLIAYLDRAEEQLLEAIGRT